MGSDKSERMTIREAAPSDAEAIARVEMESTQTTYPGIMPDGYLASIDLDEWTQRRKQRLEDPRQRDVSYVAEVEGQIVGWARGGPERSDDKEYTGELYAIYLLDAHQRRGIGTRLTGIVARHLMTAGMTSMLVRTASANTQSRQFYEALGGNVVDEGKTTVDGLQIPTVVYGWRDICPLADGQSSAGL